MMMTTMADDTTAAATTLLTNTGSTQHGSNRGSVVNNNKHLTMSLDDDETTVSKPLREERSAGRGGTDGEKDYLGRVALKRSYVEMTDRDPTEIYEEIAMDVMDEEDDLEDEDFDEEDEDDEEYRNEERRTNATDALSEEDKIKTHPYKCNGKSHDSITCTTFSTNLT